MWTAGRPAAICDIKTEAALEGIRLRLITTFLIVGMMGIAHWRVNPTCKSDIKYMVQWPHGWIREVLRADPSNSENCWTKGGC